MTKEELFDRIYPSDKKTDRAIRDKAFIDAHFDEIIATMEDIKGYRKGMSEESLLTAAIRELKINLIKEHMKPNTFDPEDRSIYDFRLVVSHTDEIFDYIEDCHKEGTFAQTQGWSEEEITEYAIRTAKAELMIDIVRAYKERHPDEEKDPFESYTRVIRTNADELYYQYQTAIEGVFAKEGREVKREDEKAQMILELMEDLDKGKDFKKAEPKKEEERPIDVESLAALPDGEFSKAISNLVQGDADKGTLELVGTIVKKAAEYRIAKRKRQQAEKESEKESDAKPDQE